MAVTAIHIDSVGKTVKAVQYDPTNYKNIYPFLSVSKESPCDCFTMGDMGDEMAEVIKTLFPKWEAKFEGMESTEVSLFVDDEGLLNQEAMAHSFFIAGSYQPFAGSGLIILTTTDDEGDEHNQSFDDDDLKTILDWLTANIKFDTARAL